jgi:hypothetical protein
VIFRVAKGLLLVFALWMIGAAALLVMRGPRPLDPTEAFAPCKRQTTEAMPLVVSCANGHAYLLQDGGWIDLGGFLAGAGVRQR